MNPFDRSLQAAQGYLELGLPREAADELDGIAPGQCADWRVRVLRVDAYQKLGEWTRLETVARELCEQRPDEAQWPISLAYATRRTRSVEAARDVLAEAVERFPAEPIIHFNLACYEAQLGHLDPARARLAEAIRLEPGCRQLALAEPDLAALARRTGVRRTFRGRQAFNRSNFSRLFIRWFLVGLPEKTAAAMRINHNRSQPITAIIQLDGRPAAHFPFPSCAPSSSPSRQLRRSAS